MPKFLGEETGALKTEFYQDMETGRLVANRVQDVEPILKQNRIERNGFNGRYGDFAKIAEIPFIVIEKMMKEGAWQAFLDGDQKAIHRWLKNPDNRALLTAHQGF